MKINSHEAVMHDVFMHAVKGLGRVAPNPLVAAIIIKDSIEISRGFHQSFGERHAEIVAIESLTDKTLLKNSTLYINLEPCSHQGKTPPCTNAIVESGITKVVISCLDPNPLVLGGGIRVLKETGIHVELGILEYEGIELNKRFLTQHLMKRPYVILKWAESSDGFIAPKNSRRVWISSIASRKKVHEQRTIETSVLVGKNTAQHDDPELTVRHVEGNNPLRILIDPQLNISKDAKILNGNAPTIIINNLKEGLEAHITYAKIDEYPISITSLLCRLNEEKIQSVIIEGGAYTLNRFIEAGLWDEAFVYRSQTKLIDGVPSPIMPQKLDHQESANLDGDMLLHSRNLASRKLLLETYSSFRQRIALDA